MKMMHLQRCVLILWRSSSDVIMQHLWVIERRVALSDEIACATWLPSVINRAELRVARTARLHVR